MFRRALVTKPKATKYSSVHSHCHSCFVVIIIPPPQCTLFCLKLADATHLESKPNTHKLTCYVKKNKRVVKDVFIQRVPAVPSTCQHPPNRDVKRGCAGTLTSPIALCLPNVPRKLYKKPSRPESRLAFPRRALQERLTPKPRRQNGARASTARSPEEPT